MLITLVPILHELCQTFGGNKWVAEFGGNLNSWLHLSTRAHRWKSSFQIPQDGELFRFLKHDQYFWVSWLRSGIMVHKGNLPKMAKKNRFVNPCNLLRYVEMFRDRFHVEQSCFKTIWKLGTQNWWFITPFRIKLAIFGYSPFYATLTKSYIIGFIKVFCLTVNVFFRRSINP